jgi:hypothetical protein
MDILASQMLKYAMDILANQMLKYAMDILANQMLEYATDHLRKHAGAARGVVREEVGLQRARR